MLEGETVFELAAIGRRGVVFSPTHGNEVIEDNGVAWCAPFVDSPALSQSLVAHPILSATSGPSLPFSSFL